MARAARGLTSLKNQINSKFPYRDKSSDGGIGDQAHSSRNSDHNPVRGVFHAQDYDHDPDSNGLNCVSLYRELKSSRDRRLKYLIFQEKIWFPHGTEKKYTGPNAHMGHLHVSVLHGVGDVEDRWNIPMLFNVPISLPNNGSKIPQTYGLTMEQARTLQRVLNAWYTTLKPLVLDGDIGPATIERVRYAQTRLRIEVDGIPGPITRKKLGLSF